MKRRKRRIGGGGGGRKEGEEEEKRGGEEENRGRKRRGGRGGGRGEGEEGPEEHTCLSLLRSLLLFLAMFAGGNKRKIMSEGGCRPLPDPPAEHVQPGPGPGWTQRSP